MFSTVAFLNETHEYHSHIDINSYAQKYLWIVSTIRSVMTTNEINSVAQLILLSVQTCLVYLLKKYFMFM